MGIILLAFIIVIIIVLLYSKRKQKFVPSFYNYYDMPGPYNMQLYETPYHYPFYEARESLVWDGASGCTASCEKSPCTIWCR